MSQGSSQGLASVGMLSRANDMSVYIYIYIVLATKRQHMAIVYCSIVDFRPWPLPKPSM